VDWFELSDDKISDKITISIIHCKHNNIFPSHLMHIDENRFHLNHYKSYSRLGTALHRFRKTILDIKIFDLNRFSYWEIILQLKIHIWLLTNIYMEQHRKTSLLFNNLYIKLYLSYKKKFSWLLINLTINKVKKIKPINFSYIIKDEHYKFIKQHHNIPYTSNNETVINRTILPLMNFSTIPKIL